MVSCFTNFNNIIVISFMMKKIKKNSLPKDFDIDSVLKNKKIKTGSFHPLTQLMNKALSILTRLIFQQAILQETRKTHSGYKALSKAQITNYKTKKKNYYLERTQVQCK